jgi:hypothetical protein
MLGADGLGLTHTKRTEPMTNTARPFTVVADHGDCVTHCSSLKGAMRSAKGFALSFTSIVIRHNGELVKVVR